jgi:PST family polysaccharide transporter
MDNARPVVLWCDLRAVNRTCENAIAVGHPMSAEGGGKDRPASADGDETAPAASPSGDRSTSYVSILKSTALVGGGQVLVMAIGLVRIKAMAVMLGPSGFGLMGIYSSIADLAVALAGMGLNNSGVRQIAEAAGQGDAHRLAKVAIVLRRISIVLGLIGAAILVLASGEISRATFGADRYVWAVSILSIAVLLRLVAAGEGAVLQGTRRIGDLTKMGVYGTLLGTVVGIPIVYALREDGVVLSIIALAGGSFVTAWWYGRKVPIEAEKVRLVDLPAEAGALLKLGLAFMASGVLMMGAAYAVRAIIVQHAGLDAAGLYAAAWTLGGLYVGIILQAMGADFYPRLVAVANDHPECNRLVNEQTEVGTLLAAPGVLATITLAPLVIAVFYSKAFVDAAEILRWICLGIALRVLTWPMGYIIVAKNRQFLFFATEFAWAAFNVALTWLLVAHYGARGAGMAFFASYLLHAAMICPLATRLTGFAWTGGNVRSILMFLVTVAIVFAASAVLPSPADVAVGLVALIGSALHAARRILSLFGDDPRLAALFDRYFLVRKLRDLSR